MGNDQNRTGDRNRIFEQSNEEVPGAERFDQTDASLIPGECSNHAADGPERCTESRRLIASDRDGGPGKDTRYDAGTETQWGRSRRRLWQLVGHQLRDRQDGEYGYGCNVPEQR